MKLISLLVGFILITTPCFADIYGYVTDDATGNVVKKFVRLQGDHFCDEGETITYCTQEELGDVTVYQEPEYVYSVCIDELWAAFAADLIALAPYFSVIDRCLYTANDDAFTKLKIFCEGLVTATVLTQEQYDAFAAILLNNQVDLSNF